MGTLAVLLLSAACAGDDGPSDALPTAPPTRSVSVTADPSPTVVGDPALCPDDQLRPTIEREIPIAEGVQIAELKVTHCRNNHARVVLIATTSDPSEAVDDLPVYLRRTAEGWSVVDYGGHITCSHEEGLSPETVTACRALEN